MKELRATDEPSLCKGEALYTGNTEKEAHAQMQDTETRTCNTPCEVMTVSLLSQGEVRLRDKKSGRVQVFGFLVSTVAT